MPSLQYVLDFQPFDDAWCFFFLVSKLPDENHHLASLSLLEPSHTS